MCVARKLPGNSRTPVIHRKKDMGYLQEIDGWLEEVLEKFIVAIENAQSEEDATMIFLATKQEIKTKVLESFHNGQKGEDSGGKPDGGWKGRFSKRFSKPRQYSKPRG